MSKKSNGVAGRTVPQIDRRKKVIVMLEAQLKSGVKTARVDGFFEKVSLTEKDTTRIKKEIEILKSRI